MPTMAEDNATTLRHYLRWLRNNKEAEGDTVDFVKQRINQCVESRKRYRSNDLVDVIVVDDGGSGPIIFDDWVEVEHHLEDIVDSLPLEDIHVSLEFTQMAGHEIGNLELFE